MKSDSKSVESRKNNLSNKTDKNGKSTKSRKAIYIISAVLLLAMVFCIIRFTVPYLQRHYHVVRIDEAAAIEGEKTEAFGRALTIYFTRVGNTDFEEDVDAVASASLMVDGSRLIGNSELLAKMVQNSVGGDIYAIATQKKYPSSYDDTVEESALENREAQPLELSGELPDISQYDTVFLVYPVWWGTVPKALDSFAVQADFDGKTVYAIATHGGSGIANSVRDFQEASGASVDENVLAVYDKDAVNSREQVTRWLESLGE